MKSLVAALVLLGAGTGFAAANGGPTLDCQKLVGTDSWELTYSYFEGEVFELTCDVIEPGSSPVVSYQWEQASGPELTTGRTDGSTLRVKTPEFYEGEIWDTRWGDPRYVEVCKTNFTLTVTDANGLTATDDVTFWTESDGDATQGAYCGAE